MVTLQGTMDIKFNGYENRMHDGKKKQLRTSLCATVTTLQLRAREF
jgi:hypothetical protein